jgi:FkbH-like protein
MSEDKIKSLRENLKKDSDHLNLEDLQSLIRDLCTLEPTTSSFSFCARICQTQSARFNLKSKNLALLTSFTIEPLQPFLEVHAFLTGYSIHTTFFPYNQWQKELMNPDTLIQQNITDIILLHHLEDILPEVGNGFLSLSKQDRESAITSHVNTLVASFNMARKKMNANFILGDVPFVSVSTPERSFRHGFERGDQRRTFLGELNREAAIAVSQISGTSHFAYRDLIEDFGRNRFFDVAKNNLNQTAVSSIAYPSLAQKMIRHLRNIWEPQHKLVILDCDNTLWGGVIGEDGLQGIQLGQPGKGRGFQNFQSYLKELHRFGILLALNSKNNLEDVKEVFENHPESILKWSDFASIQVNWTEKAQNIRQIALDLNLGLSSMIFIDDNPLECARVKQMLPEVTVVMAEGPPEFFSERINSASLLEPQSINPDDLQRNERYHQERSRKEVSSQFTDYNDFLKSLELQLEVRLATKEDLPRLVQLANKTNQFNTTTIRYTDNDILDCFNDPNTVIASMSLGDKFGQYGLIGMFIARILPEEVRLENYLMSCRILGRNVEEAVMAILQQLTSEKGKNQLTGLFMASKKNQLVAPLFEKFGFKTTSEKTSLDQDIWIWEVSDKQTSLPTTLTLHTDIIEMRKT